MVYSEKLAGISDTEMKELKAYSNPPRMVRMVMQAW